MQPTITDLGRGPEITGTRITVYDIWDYAKVGHHHTYIAVILGVSSRQVLAARDYITASAHQSGFRDRTSVRKAVLAMHETILPRRLSLAG